MDRPQHTRCTTKTRHQHTPAGSVRVIYGLRRSLRPVRGGETTRHVPVSASSAPTACVRMSIHKENPDPRQAARQIAKRVAWISPGRQSWLKYGLAMRKLCRQRTWGPPARPPSRPALRSRSGESRQVGSAGAVRRRKCRPEVLAERQGRRARAAGTPLCRLTATGRAALALGRKAGAILRGGGWRLRERLTVYLPDPDQEIRRSKHRRLATRQEVLLWKSCSARPVFLRKLT